MPRKAVLCFFILLSVGLTGCTGGTTESASIDVKPPETIEAIKANETALLIENLPDEYHLSSDELSILTAELGDDFDDDLKKLTGKTSSDEEAQNE